MAIGIDPGLGGAIAVYGLDGYYAERMPTMATNAKGKRCVNPLGVKDLLVTMGKQTVYLEKVHAMPKNGSIANFSMGSSFECVRTCCLLLGFPLVVIKPTVWKKYYRLTSDKEQCRARAIELFPEENLNLKKDVDRAEALLIAYYGANL